MAWHVAVVEDDRENAAALREVLEAEGFAVQCFASGAAVLDGLTAGAARFDAVVSDIRMPDLDGVALLRELQARWPALPVFLVSAFPEETVWATALQAGAVDVFPKPIRGTTLAEALRAAIAHARQRSAA